MVFVDGQKRSIEGIIKVFDEFAGCLDQNREDLLATFPFNAGQLPVKYLGRPLLTKRMTKSDYEPLIEQIRSKMRAWTGRYLSFAGRLKLL